MDKKKPTQELPEPKEPTKAERAASRRQRHSMQPLLLRYHGELLEQARNMPPAEELFDAVMDRARKKGVLGP